MEENLKQLTVDKPIARFAIIGASAAQTAALASDLAAHFNTVAALSAHNIPTSGEPEAFQAAAARQIEIENAQMAQASQYLFCDSAILLTKVTSEMLCGTSARKIAKAARKHKYDLFLFLPSREDAAYQQMTAAIEGELTAQNKAFVILEGSHILHDAITIIQQLDKAKKLDFTPADFAQMHRHGLNIDTVAAHISIVNKGIAKIVLDRPVTDGDGLTTFTLEEYQALATSFDGHKESLQLEKFVPASGAASRMFKFLTSFYNEFDPEHESINAYINRKQAADLSIFLAGIEKFPFFDAVVGKLRADFADFAEWPRNRKYYQFIKTMLANPDFDFCNKPKAVLPFHKYADHIATPIEEHLYEAVTYAAAGENACIHFTVSDNHQPLFETVIGAVKAHVEKEYNSVIKVGFSHQDPATDTVAIDMSGNPFRDANNKLVFRPAGHGALLSNLNNLDSDIIFITNIDNVIQDHIATISLYKKALAGLLLQLREQVFGFLEKMEHDDLDGADIEAIREFVQKKLNIKLNADFDKYTPNHKKSHLQKLLNRPMRVCGMVKNEGEPGGGPFWVRDNKGNETIQIVETSQVDMQNAKQLKVVQSARYFNPVDIVCGIRDYRGKTFDLASFTDPDTGFIVIKNKNGRDLQAYEMPGLWNGAMANWITIFAEVPLITFNPVKTVNDLLKPAHQPQ